ncbi:MAG: thioester domain-containing protein [Solobacterium sp.]|nr:thioester domain-containing protein [Solobacterium sp.]
MKLKRLIAAVLAAACMFAGSRVQAEEPVTDGEGEETSLIGETEPEAEEPSLEGTESPVPEALPGIPEADREEPAEAEEKEGDEETGEPDEEPAEQPEDAGDSSGIANADADGSAGEIIDLHETARHASFRMRAEESGQRGSPEEIQTDTARLTSLGRIAQFTSVIDPSAMDYISMFFLDDRVCYCVEPGVSVVLINGVGSIYEGRTWDSLDEETRMRCKRISFFGYGFPQTGTSLEAYAATQLLIWEAVVPDLYQGIYDSLHMCSEPHSEYKACAIDKADALDGTMNSIRSLAESYDTVPSFANNRHGVNRYSVEWDKTLDLKDRNNVLGWFQPDSEEDHPGIHLKVKNNHLLIDIDDLYYAGYDDPNGLTLTFRRDEEQWDNMYSGVLLYTCGSQQKLMAATGIDPTPQYQISVRLKTADAEIVKLDEYLNTGSFAAGTEFLIGWAEDPEKQYEEDGDHDPEWTEYHDPSKHRKDDLGTPAKGENGVSLYYPIMTEDGSAVRTFAVDADGVLRIQNLLPEKRKWWFREVRAGNAFSPDERVWSVTTPRSGKTVTMDFVNPLRDVTLEVTKRDEEDSSEKIDEARFVLYETGEDLDLDRNPTPYGTEVNLNRSASPMISYRDLKERSTLQAGDRFLFNGYLYTIEEITGTQYILKAVKESAYSPEDTECFSRYQLSEHPVIGETVETAVIQTMHGTADPLDDEGTLRRGEITDIRAENGTVRLTVSETEAKANVLIREDTDPDFASFLAAAEAQNVPLERGSRLTVARTVYTLKSVNETSLIASPDRTHTIDLSDAKPEWSDIPDAGTLVPGDTFTLFYPYSEDGESFETREITFTVLSNGPGEMIVSEGQNEYRIAAPDRIRREDIPDKVESEEIFRVRSVRNPVYIAEDDRGNIYRISDSGTEVLQTAEESSASGHANDISYAELIGRDDAAGSACEDPYEAAGCPVGLSRTKDIPQSVRTAYEGPQYEELSEEERARDAVWERNGTRYTVKACDAVSLTVSYFRDGIEYEAELFREAVTQEAVHTELHPVTFTVKERQEKEFDLEWTSIVPGKNSRTDDPYLHLSAYGEEGVRGDLRFEMIPAECETGDSFSDPNGTEYRILYLDRLGKTAVLESEGGRYEVTPEAAVSIMPVSWSTVVAMEQERGAVFFEGDTFSLSVPHSAGTGDVFELGGTQYVLLPEGKLFYAWDPSSLFSAEFIQEAGSAFTEGDHAFTVSLIPRNGFSEGLLKDETGNTAGIYILQDVSSERIVPYEEAEPVYRLEVDMPSDVLFEDLEAVRYREKKPGMHVTIAGIEYRIEEMDETAETAAVRDGEGIVYSITNSTEDPFDYAVLKNTPADLKAGDEVTIQGETYRCVSVSEHPECGTIVLLKRISDHSLIEVRRFPDTNAYETETLTCYEIGKEYPLSRAAGEWGFRLRTENPHIELREENGGWIIRAEEHTTAVLETLDADGDAIRVRRILFSSSWPEGDVTGLPVFAGYTGHQYLRITDSTNHNMPIPGKTVVLFNEEALEHSAGTYVSDEYGAIDLSSLEPGVYWYQDPVTPDVRHIAVESSARVKGQLRVNGLKWGRTYLALETELPEGYDYGSGEVIHSFTMNAAEGTDTIRTSIENRIRRIELRVFKLDQDDEKTPLNNAWFTAEDITNAGSFRSERNAKEGTPEIQLSDIPEGAKAGDIIPVWPAKEGGTLFRYRIEKVLANEVLLSRLVNGAYSGQYHVPVKGYSTTAPMLYRDIVRAVGIPRANEVFDVYEKDPQETIRQYRILTVEKGSADDIFGNSTDQNEIVRAAVQDIRDSSGTILTLGAEDDTDVFTGTFLGEFISGGILKRAVHEETEAPLTFEEAVQAGARQNGDRIRWTMRRTADMPSYDAA